MVYSSLYKTKSSYCLLSKMRWMKLATDSRIVVHKPSFHISMLSCPFWWKLNLMILWLLSSICLAYSRCRERKRIFQTDYASSFLPESNYTFAHTYNTLQRDTYYFSPPFPIHPYLPYLNGGFRKTNNRHCNPRSSILKPSLPATRGAFMRFSVSPANCAGRNFAWLELWYGGCVAGFAVWLGIWTRL